MLKRSRLNQTKLRRLICYNPLSGTFMWRITPGKRIQRGKKAGSIFKSKGPPYQRIRIFGHSYLAHRLAFLYMRGHWPRNQVDHKDRNGLNNRWLNLRECTNSQNAANRGSQKNNKLGIKGVHKSKSEKYHAQIKVNGKRIHLGTFDTAEAATHAYQKAANKYFGKFARF